MGSFVYFLCLLSKLWFFKCKKWLIVFISAFESKKSITVRTNYLSSSERSHWVLSESDVVNRLWSYRSLNIKGRISKSLLSHQKNENLLFSRVEILLMVAQNPLIHRTFWFSHFKIFKFSCSRFSFSHYVPVYKLHI